MKQIEELLHRERAAGVPNPPDARYTINAIRRATGTLPASRPVRKEPEWLPALGAVCLVVVALLCLGLSPWWLLIIPALALSTTPILLRREA